MSVQSELLLQPQSTAVDPATTTEATVSALNRREFLTYTWGAALALLTAEAALASYFFLQPRFRVGEFGGKFQLGAAASLPNIDAAPVPDSTGKFWLVNTENGPKALYMVCTHLGCLYKWEAQENRFKCPCHASQFTREGHYIEGPAPRSLDQFVIEVVQEGETVEMTTEGADGAQPPRLQESTAQLVVNTGKRIPGQPKELSPARVTNS